MAGTAYQSRHDTSNTVAEPGTAPCRHQVQAHHNASDTVEPGTAPCHHEVHHGAGITETAPCHQQACPSAQRLLATSSTEDDTTEAVSHWKHQFRLLLPYPAAYNATSNWVSSYVSFDKLLLPLNTPPIMVQSYHTARKNSKRQLVTDITS